MAMERRLQLKWSYLGDIKSVEVHDLAPRRHEVLNKLRLRIRASVDLGESAEPRVRAEDEIDASAGPLHLACLTVTPFEHVTSARDGPPLGPHVEQIHEEVVGQALRPLRKDAVLGLPEVRVQHTHSADKNRHLGRGQREQLRLVDQQLLGRDRVLALVVIAETIGDRFEHGERFHVSLLG